MAPDHDDDELAALRGRVRDLEQLLDLQERVVVEHADQGAAALARLMESEAHSKGLVDYLRILWERSPIPKLLFDVKTLRIREANPSAAALYGYSYEEIVELRIVDLKAESDDPELHGSMKALTERGKGGSRWAGTKKHRRKDGSVIDVEITAHHVDVHGGVSVLAAVVDVTAKRQLEEQVRHSQKMEAVGLLAGGIAHDFNNILSVILSYATLLLEDLPHENPHRADVSQIRLAADRAARLTKQLLAFSRKQILEPTATDLNDLVVGMEKLLRPLLGEGVGLEINVSDAAGKVFVDRGQLEQVVMNLVVNARDASKRGGRVTIETLQVTLDEESAKTQPGVGPGSWVRLSVIDDGAGIAPEVVGRIFEPFFTTKSKDRGTGLGLSTVLGIVEQSGGHITVQSRLDEGTSIHVFLPGIDGTATSSSTAAPLLPELHGAETILLVEDEEQVRRSVRVILARQGYRVLEAQNGGEAFMICERHSGPIDLLVTDVVMPVMNGREVATRLGAMRPRMKVLYMSGHTEDSIVRNGALEPGIAFLPKPITVDALVRKVRDVLAQG